MTDTTQLTIVQALTKAEATKTMKTDLLGDRGYDSLKKMRKYLGAQAGNRCPQCGKLWSEHYSRQSRAQLT